jgi:hypothetical protein
MKLQEMGTTPAGQTAPALGDLIGGKSARPSLHGMDDQQPPNRCDHIFVIRW